MLYDFGGMLAKQIEIPSTEPDKILLVAVGVVPGGLTASARDFDVRTRTLSAAVTRPVWQIGSLGDAALDALLAAYAPLARIESVEKDVAVLRVKSGGLPLRDPNLKLLCKDDVLRPIVRHNDRDNKFRDAVPAHWSLCSVDKIEPDMVKCLVFTGMRGEMATRGRGRAELLALKVISPGGGTTVLLESAAKPQSPLAGYDLYAYPPNDKKAAVLLGQTNRQGRLVVSPGGGSMMRVLLVKNGMRLLAKLPIVPGLEPLLTANIPNDDQRLAAEGFINGFREELIDLVARQKILARQIRTCIEKKDFEQASKYITDLRQLPTPQQFATAPYQGAGEAGLRRALGPKEDRRPDERHPASD